MKWLLALLSLVTACAPAGASTSQASLTSTATRVPLAEPSPTPQPVVLPTLAYKVCDPTTDTIGAAFIGDIDQADVRRLPPSTKFKKT